MRSARWLTFGSAAAIMLSIAPSQILLAVCVCRDAGVRREVRLPRIWLPLGLFMLGTVISLLVSDDPTARPSADPQVLCLSELLVVFSLSAQSDDGALVVSYLGGARRIDAMRGFVQFAGKIQQAHRAGSQLLPILCRRANHRLHQPLEHLFGGRDVRVLMIWCHFCSSHRRRGGVPGCGCSALSDCPGYRAGETRGICDRGSGGAAYLFGTGIARWWC